MLPGEVKIGKRTLANIRSPWIVKMGLMERAKLSATSWLPSPVGWGLKAGVGTVAPLLGTQVIILPSVLHVPGHLSTERSAWPKPTDRWCPSGDMDNSQTLQEEASEESYGCARPAWSKGRCG